MRRQLKSGYGHEGRLDRMLERMNFGLIMAAVALTIVAFIVATSNEEIRADPPHRGIHLHQKHHLKVADHRRIGDHSVVAALGNSNHPSFR